MRILLIMTIAGLVLLGLGSPDKVKQAGQNLANVVKQSPEQISEDRKDESHVIDTPLVTLPENTDFSSVEHQADIPAADVLGQPVTPKTEVVSLTVPYGTSSPKTYGYQDRYSIEEIHSVNAAALEILDRISNSYQ